MFYPILYMICFFMNLSLNQSLSPPFSVRDHQIIDSKNEIVNIHGVSKSGFEYLYLDVQVFTNTSIQFDIQLMKEWNINTVRFPLRDIYWEISDYRQIIHYFIDQLWKENILSIIDLHTQGSSYGLDPFLLRKPEGVYDAMQFWQEVAFSFQTKDHVWFELFNEPYQISPDTWWNGNEMYYGYREIVQRIRSITPRIVILGGLDYAYQWNFLHYYPSIKQELLTIDNLVLTTHPYGYKGRPVQNGTQTDPIPIQMYSIQDEEIKEGDCSMGYTLPTVSSLEYGWNESFGFLLDEFPLLFTEFGLDRIDSALQGGWYMMDLMDYLRLHQHVGWIAWAWVRERLDYPSLLQENFQPTGIARYKTKGPACSVSANQFYPGPGLLIYNYLTDIPTQKRMTLFSFSFLRTWLVVSDPIHFYHDLFPIFICAISIFLFLFLFLFLSVWIHRRSTQRLQQDRSILSVIMTTTTTNPTTMVVDSRPFLRLRSIRSLDSMI